MAEANAEWDNTLQRKQPGLAEALKIVEAVESPTAARSAQMLYHLGSALNREGKARRLDSGEQARVASAVAKLTGLMLAEEPSNPGSKRIEQLDGKELSLSAWALSKAKPIRGVQVSRLGLALADEALHGAAMDAVGWRNWSGLLYGLANAGITCRGHKQVEQLFAKAVTQCLPGKVRQDGNPQSVSNTFYATAIAGYAGDLVQLVSALAVNVDKVMQGAKAQEWANMLWAFGRHDDAKAGRLGQGLVGIVEAGVAAVRELANRDEVKPQDVSNVLWALAKLGHSADVGAIHDLAAVLARQAGNAKPQELANTLWALARLGSGIDLGVVRELVTAIVEQASKAKSQELANTLWALGKLGWYDAAVYSSLLLALLHKDGGTKPQHFSNALLGCAEAQHWDSSVEGLAGLISMQDEQQWGQWNGQDVANSLYAWAVFTAVGAAPASSSFSKMAQQLFGQAARVGFSGYNESGKQQLFLAHRVAEHVGLPGGGLLRDSKLLQACAQTNKSQLFALQEGNRRTASMEIEVVAALQHAGYEVERAVVVEGKFVQMRAQGTAFRVVTEDQFLVPPARLRGSIAVHVAHAGWVCKGCVVVSELEWAELQGDKQRQQDFLMQCMLRVQR